MVFKISGCFFAKKIKNKSPVFYEITLKKLYSNPIKEACSDFQIDA